MPEKGVRYKEVIRAPLVAHRLCVLFDSLFSDVDMGSPRKYSSSCEFRHT